ncbi:MAG: Gfo/Idh/MocA family protein [Armatimonadota bacterium]
MPIKVAIVGCGEVARRHIYGYQQVEDAQLVAMCDIVPERAQACAAKHGGRPYCDVVEMLETEAPDIVDVCTRETDRDVPVIQSVERGFTTLAETPLFAAGGGLNVRPDDVPVGRRMVEIADQVGAELFMAFNYRFGESAQRLKAMIDGGELGPLQSVQAWTRLACWPHVIDLLRWLCGDIVGVAAALWGSPEAPTRAGALRFAGGAVGTLLGEGVRPAHHDTLRIEWTGSEATAVLRDVAGGLELYPHAPDRPATIAPAAEDSRGGFMATFEREIAALCAHVREGVQTALATGWDGLRQLEVDAAYVLSAEAAAWVNPQEQFTGAGAARPACGKNSLTEEGLKWWGAEGRQCAANPERGGSADETRLHPH